MAASPGRFLPGPNPPAQRCRRLYAPSSRPPPVPPPVPPAVSAPVGARLGQAALRRAPAGSPFLASKNTNSTATGGEGRRERRPSGAGCPAAPSVRLHPLRHCPSDCFPNGRSLTALSCQWARRGGGSARAAGLFPAVPASGSGGRVPPGAPGPRAAAGRRGAVALRRAIRGCGIAGGVADFETAARGGSRSAAAERQESAAVSGDRGGAAPRSRVRERRADLARPRRAPGGGPALRRRRYGDGPRGAGGRGGIPRVPRLKFPTSLSRSERRPCRYGNAAAPFPISQRVS